MKNLIFAAILTLVIQVSPAERKRVTVSNYTLHSGLFVIHASAEGKPIDLLCNEDSPFCSPPAPGEYWMVDWTVPLTEYLGDYVCKEVDLYRIAANSGRDRKTGEYCLVEKSEAAVQNSVHP